VARNCASTHEQQNVGVMQTTADFNLSFEILKTFVVQVLLEEAFDRNFLSTTLASVYMPEATTTNLFEVFDLLWCDLRGSDVPGELNEAASKFGGAYCGC